MTIGGAECVVTSASASQLVCTVGESSGGSHHVVLFVNDKGKLKFGSGFPAQRNTVLLLLLSFMFLSMIHLIFRCYKYNREMSNVCYSHKVKTFLLQPNTAAKVF